MDTLSRVVLTESADARWRAFAASPEVQDVLRHEFAGPSEIPDELAREEPDGSLTIYVPLPSGGAIAMTVDSTHWAWAGPRNQ